jgi:hypothetical protein
MKIPLNEWIEAGNETCLMCDKKVFSRAAHQMYCPHVMTDFDPKELAVLEERQNVSLYNLITKR